MTSEWNFDSKWEMEQINKGKIRWVPTLVGVLMVLVSASAPFLVSQANLPPTLFVVFLYGSVALWATIRIVRQRRVYDGKWKSLMRQVCGFYEEFDILPQEGSSLSYGELVEKVREVLISLATLVLTTTGDAQAEARRFMGEKYDTAQQFLSPDFNKCRGYRFFFEAAQKELDIKNKGSEVVT